MVKLFALQTSMFIIKTIYYNYIISSGGSTLNYSPGETPSEKKNYNFAIIRNIKITLNCSCLVA